MNEVDIRARLIEYLSDTAAGRDAAFIPELFLDNFARRADLVMANGKLAAFEIKSARDSLDRLEGQLETYARFFEQVTVVCAAKHVRGVSASAHHSVGVWSIDAEGTLEVIRKAKLRRLRTKETWLAFLPVDELRAMLKGAQLRTTGDRVTLVARAEDLQLDLIRAFVLCFLKRRDARIQTLIARRDAKVAARSSLKTAVPLPEICCAQTATPRKIRAHTSGPSSRSSSASPSASAILLDRSNWRDK